MKKLAATLITIIALLALTGCGEPAGTSGTAQPLTDKTAAVSTPGSDTALDPGKTLPDTSADEDTSPADTADETPAPLNPSEDTTSAEATAVTPGPDSSPAAPTPSDGSPSSTASPATAAPTSGQTDTYGSFTIKTSNGAFTRNGSVYTITAAGDYYLSGSLNGRIIVSAPENAGVVLNLSGVSITCADNSPIFARSADHLYIAPGSGTKNTLTDGRSVKVSDDDDDDSTDPQGAGVITAKCDLTLQGSGSLTVAAGYNNGVHCTKDLTLRELSLNVNAPNNAVKGKNSVTVESGKLTLISTAGDGIKTEDSAVSVKGRQQGTVTVNSGDIIIYAAGDGIQAACDFEMKNGTLTIYNGDNSQYTSKNTSIDSYKGIKVKNHLKISGGTVIISSQDDGLHADYGTKLDNGSSGLGNITISGGTVAITTSSTVSYSGGGFGGGPGGGWGGFGGKGFGPGGGGGGSSGADAIHADNTLSITGGTVTVSTSYEGLEANIIKISGGDITVAASDDGLNASRKIGLAPSITISGGRIDITMGSGDTDGIDSNGSFAMTGGVVIVRGAPNSTNGMATGLDCDAQASFTGGTFIQLGPRETVPSLGSGCRTLNFGSNAGRGGKGGRGGPDRQSGTDGQQSAGSCTFGSGTWTLSGLGISFTVAEGCSYSGAAVYSSMLSAGAEYTLSSGSTVYRANAQ